MPGREPPDATGPAPAYGRNMETTRTYKERANGYARLGLAFGHLSAAGAWLYGMLAVVLNFESLTDAIVFGLLIGGASSWLSAAVVMVVRWRRGSPAARFVGLWLVLSVLGSLAVAELAAAGPA
jgi:hypothetical protein